MAAGNALDQDFRLAGNALQGLKTAPTGPDMAS